MLGKLYATPVYTRYWGSSLKVEHHFVKVGGEGSTPFFPAYLVKGAALFP